MRRLSLRTPFLFWLLFLLSMPSICPVFASPDSKLKTVCTNELTPPQHTCDYDTVQDAIDSITDSSATNVYTVFIDSGELLTRTSISTGGKSYINFVGRGIGVSVLRAAPLVVGPPQVPGWFDNVLSGATDPAFFNLSGSTNITIRGLTIDARTNDPGNIASSSLPISAVKLDNTDKILFEESEAQGLNYGMWEQIGSGGLIQVMNSKVGAVRDAINANQEVWHIFASDIRATLDGTQSPYLADAATNAVDVSGQTQVTIWGSHLHAEGGVANDLALAALREVTSTSKIDIISSTLHMKLTTTDVGSPTRPMAAFIKLSLSTVNIVGSELLYETPNNITQGIVAGVYYSGGGTGGTNNLVGSTIVDRAGSGGTRADLILGQGQSPTVRTTGTVIKTAKPMIGSLPANFAALETTINTQKGTVQLNGGQATVSFPPYSMPNATYAVAVTGNMNEVFYVPTATKTTTSFIIMSSNPSSSAKVDWTLTR